MSERQPHSVPEAEHFQRRKQQCRSSGLGQEWWVQRIRMRVRVAEAWSEREQARWEMTGRGGRGQSTEGLVGQPERLKLDSSGKETLLRAW